MLCIRHLLGLCAPKDYFLPQTMLVSPTSISIDKKAVVLTALCGSEKQKRHFLLLNPHTKGCVHAFDAALTSLTSFVHAKRNMFIRFVQNRRRDCNVLIDVEHYDAASIDANCASSSESESHSNCDVRQELLVCQRAMRAAPHCYFLFTVQHGAVLWIAALRSNERGNRFPTDERAHTVIRFATLERYLRSSVTL